MIGKLPVLSSSYPPCRTAWTRRLVVTNRLLGSSLTLLVRVEDVVLRLYGRMARVSAV
jgi:hypothetical protein